MGRHSLPDDAATPSSGAARVAARRRTVALATALVMAVAGGTAIAVQRGLLSFRRSCAASAVRLDLVASPDIAPAVRAVADRARTEKITSDGSCMDVRVSARDSYEVSASLASPAKPDFSVWIPDASLWVDRAKDAGESAGVVTAGHIAASPVALAVVPSAAKPLGWPQKTYTWAELATATAQDDKLRLGSADPARSASGLLALSCIAKSAASGGADGDTRTAALAKVLSQRVSAGDGQAVRTLAPDGSADPHRNQALVLSEQSAFAYNASHGAGDHLRLFYPKDGAPQLDYPYTMVRETRMSTDESRAAMRFMSLLGDPESLRVLAGQGFRTQGRPVADPVASAAGAGAPQPYASASAEPPSAQELQDALGMWTITVQSARLTTVVDASGSMADPVPGSGGRSRMDVTKSSLLQALSQFTPDDEIGLWDFATHLDGSRDYRRLVPTARLGDPADDGQTQREKLTRAFGALQPVPGGATGLFDTTLAAYKEAASTYASGKFNAVVLLTDGANEDPGSISRAGLMAELQKLRDPAKPVPLIAIAVGPQADADVVRQIARATGGAGYQVNDPADLQAVILKAITALGEAQANG
ncbi:substrate-binding and VWA domain-containing protein [Streptomyces sp. NBC_00083]|uniref:substrate-binding and VWA domain-containing protein n=1 Tax=Streptomyces sp. NBC_00083 TaxID=2975647 RepID=UPI00225C213C|nr:substrate-binding and VWA domain-containing protein [Streptomyces sp. NBC_00083]MCX5383691.1 substrate-binding and VWA domain-containing protein [Streptomyces sp. NBC_00083]